MLFKNRDFKSIYDFGEPMPEKISLDSLAKEIDRITTAIVDYAEGETSREGRCIYKDIRLQHNDIRGNEIAIRGKQLIEYQEKQCTRTKDHIKQLLYRPEGTDIKDAPTAISRSLDKWGLHAPDGFHTKRNLEAIQDNYTYLQVLYFFYIMRYFVFYEYNFFLQISFDQISSIYSPLPSSSHGQYWGFIIANALDDPIAAERYYLRDMACTARVQIITEVLDELISTHNSPDQNIHQISKVRNLITDVCSIESASLPPNDGSVDWLLTLSYRYQLVAYASDMVSNLKEENHPFDFPELEIEINRGWKERVLREDEIDAFLKETQTVSFCKQQKEERVGRADKGIRDAAPVFLKDVINYDKSIYYSQGRGLFIETITDSAYIRADTVALIIKAFYDIGNQNETLRMIYRSGDKKRKEQKLKSALTASGKKHTGLIADLVIRLFLVAFQSECLNAYCGHGYYWALFKNVYLAKYILIQEIVKDVFSSSNPCEWSRRLYDIGSGLQKFLDKPMGEDIPDSD